MSLIKSFGDLTGHFIGHNREKNRMLSHCNDMATKPLEFSWRSDELPRF